MTAGSRSGSSCRSAIATPFGHRKPCENTSSASPRTLTTSSSRTVTSSPHVASQNGQVRNAVRSMEPEATASRAVALLVLLARPAPAWVVAPELLVLVDAALLDDGHAARRHLLVVVAVRAGLVLRGAARVGER